MEFVVIGAEPQHGWRRSIPENKWIRIGRDPKHDWAVPWDPHVSREHADVILVGSRLRVRCLESARNSAYFHGQPTKDFMLDAGEEFRIGTTIFRLDPIGQQEDEPPTGFLEPTGKFVTSPPNGDKGIYDKQVLESELVDLLKRLEVEEASCTSRDQAQRKRASVEFLKLELARLKDPEPSEDSSTGDYRPAAKSADVDPDELAQLRDALAASERTNSDLEQLVAEANELAEDAHEKWQASERRCDELATDLETLQSRAGESHANDERRRQEIAELTAMVESLQSQIESGGSAQSELSGELERLRDEEHTQRQRANDLEEKLDAFQQQFDSDQDSGQRELENRLRLQSELDEARENAAKESDRAAGLTEQLAAAEAARVDLQARLEETAGQRDEQQHRVEEVSEEFATWRKDMEAELEPLRAALDQAAQGTEEERDLRVAEQQARESAEQQLAANQQALHESQRRMAELESNVTRLTAAQDRESKEVERLNGVLHETREQVDRLRHELSEKTDELRRVETSRASLDESRQAVEDVMARQLAEIESLSVQIKTIRSESDAARLELANAQQQFTEQHDQAERKQAEVEALQKQLAESEQARDVLDGELARQRTELGTVQVAVESLENRLEEELAVRQELEGQAAKLDEFESQIERLRQHLDESETRREQAEAEANATKAEFDRWVSENAQLQQQVAELRSELADKDELVNEHRTTRVDLELAMAEHLARQRATDESKLKVNEELRQAEGQAAQWKSETEVLKANIQSLQAKVELEVEARRQAERQVWELEQAGTSERKRTEAELSELRAYEAEIERLNNELHARADAQRKAEVQSARRLEEDARRRAELEASLRDEQAVRKRVEQEAARWKMDAESDRARLASAQNDGSASEVQRHAEQVIAKVVEQARRKVEEAESRRVAEEEARRRAEEQAIQFRAATEALKAQVKRLRQGESE